MSTKRNFLGYESDEDDANETNAELQAHQEAPPELKGLAKWMRKETVDEEQEDFSGRTEVRSKQEKRSAALATLCTDIEMSLANETQPFEMTAEKLKELVGILKPVTDKASLPACLYESWLQLQDEIRMEAESKAAFAGDVPKSPTSPAGATAAFPDEAAAATAPRLADAEDDEDSEEAMKKAKLARSERKYFAEIKKLFQEFTVALGSQLRVWSAKTGEESGASKSVIDRDDRDNDEEWTEEKFKEKFDAVQRRAKGRTETYERIAQKATERSMLHWTIPALSCVVSSAFEEDSNPNFPSKGAWKKAFDAMERTFTLSLLPGRSVVEKRIDVKKNMTWVDGGFEFQAQLIYQQLIKYFQWNDVVTENYFDWVRFENKLLAFLDALLVNRERASRKAAAGKIAIIMLDIIGPRTARAHEQLFCMEKNWSFVTSDLSASIHALHDIVAAADRAEDTRRATMHLIYHHAISNRFQAARDLLLRSHVLDELTTFACATKEFDVIKIHANRVIAQVGLSAFRVGLFNEAYAILGDLCSRKLNKIAEALGQGGVSRRKEDGVDKFAGEVFDRDRMVPPHRHISVDVINAAYLVLSMLIDTLAQAKNPFDTMLVRNAQFVDVCRYHSSAPIVGAPSELTDHVYVAYQHLLRGEIAAALSVVEALPMWNHLPDKSATLALLGERIKLDGLRIFLIAQGCNFVTLTLDHLVTKFLLSEELVFTTVSRLLQDSNIVGFWDHADRVLTIERGTMSKLHHMAKGASERIARLADYNSEVASEQLAGRGDAQRHRATWAATPGTAQVRGRGRGRGAGRGRGGGRGGD